MPTIPASVHRPSCRRFARLVIAVAAAAVALAAEPSPSAATGSGAIEGRVFNPATGEYLEFAKISVVETSLETLTDASGEYRLANVPAGEAQVKAFRTGLSEQTATVLVAAGAVARHDFNLAETAPHEGAAIKLDQFVVASSREMDGAAIAINTQRFAAGIENVVAANEFGPVADGGVGEALKSMPGIQIIRGGFGDAFTITLDGVPPNNVPVMVGGFSLANAASNTQRATGLQQVSINNFARLEVVYTATPDTPGSALGGYVNLVPLSAFDRSKPVYSVSASVMMRGNDRHFDDTPGPLNHPAPKAYPGIDFSAIVPVTSRLGFTLSGSTSTLYTSQGNSQNGWRGGGLATNGTTLPNTPPGQPYLTDYSVQDRPVLSKRTTVGATLDFRPTKVDVLSLGFMYGFSDAQAYGRQVNFLANAVVPGGTSLTATQGAAGAGTINVTNNATKLGGGMYTPSLTWRHNGPVWHTEAGLGVSESLRYNRNLDNGTFSNVVAQRKNVTVSYNNINYLRPGTITVTDAPSGAPVDPFNLSAYTLNTANGVLLNEVFVSRTAFASASRDLPLRVPIKVKAGLDYRESIVDQRTVTPVYTFVGADGIAGTGDDNAAQVLDASFSQRTLPFGFPRSQAMSNQQLYNIFKAHPNYFTINNTTTYTNAVTNSKFADEKIPAAYFRADGQFLDNRLKLTGGIRAEQTNVKGEGGLTDPTRNFQRDAAGRFVVGANGRPLPITTDPLASAQLTNVDRGLVATKEYLRWFPSLNGTFNLRDNLVARAGYYWSVGRPNFNQYAGSLTLPDTSNPPGPANLISVNNAGIRAWQAKTFRASLEYYFSRVGLISIGGYERRIDDFFGSTVFQPTPAFLGLYGLDPAVYGQYSVATQYNISNPVKMSGVNINYKQALTFLPDWAQGVQVFANASAQHITGDDAGNFSGYVPRIYNWGLSFTRPRFNVRMNWSYNSRARQAIVAAGPSIEPGTYTWASKRLLIDLSATWNVWRQTALWLNLSNLDDAPVDLKIYGPSTPALARFRSRQDNGAQWLFGIKSTF